MAYITKDHQRRAQANYIVVFNLGYATIPNHINGSRNYLESLPESENQVEIFELWIIISTFILAMWCTSPDLVNRNHKNQFGNLGIKPRIQNHVDKNSELRILGIQWIPKHLWICDSLMRKGRPVNFCQWYVLWYKSVSLLMELSVNWQWKPFFAIVCVAM